MTKNNFLGLDDPAPYLMAGSDLLVGLDKQFIVQNVVDLKGSGQHLALQNAIKRPFSTAVSLEDQFFLHYLLKNLSPQKTIQPFRLSLCDQEGKTRYAMVGGYRDGEGNYYLSISFSTRAQQPLAGINPKCGHLLNRRGFTQIACDRLQAAASNREKVKLSFFVIKGLFNISLQYEETLPEPVTHFQDKIYGLLRSFSVGGESASILAVDRFAVVHSASIDGLFIRQALEELIETYPDFASTLDMRHYTIELDTNELGEQDSMRALIHSIAKFADAGLDDFPISTLGDSAKSILRETPLRIKMLRETIENRSFEIVYQSIVSIKTRLPHHYEALTRLVDVASTGDIVSFAEEIGIVEDFDLAVFQKVLEALNQALMQGPIPRVAVNISALSLESNMFLIELDKIMSPYVHLAQNIMFEITETSHLSDFQRANRIIQRLRKKGHEVCLDDVGAGTTSFQSLYNLEVDFAKIDGLCIKMAENDERQSLILKSITKICTELGVRMIAEQIETERQADYVQNLGIEFGQGYLFSHPQLECPVQKSEGRGHPTTPYGLRGTGRSEKKI